MAEPNNKFNANTTWGDTEPWHPSVEADNHFDREHDGSGIPNVNQGEKKDLDMALEPNKFPRETGHDTLTGDEVVFS